MPPCPFAADPGLITGQALRDPPRACPVGLGNPLNLLKGSRYAYTLNRLLSPEGEQGQFVPSFNNPLAYSGDLTIQGRSVNNYFPFVVGTTQGINFPFMPNYDTQGRYVIYNDCSGGELLFMANGFSLQLEFVFSKADFSQIFLLRDDLAYPSPSPCAVPPVMAGIANRQ